MALEIKKAKYYESTMEGHAKEGANLLISLSDAGVNLLAFKAAPVQLMRTKFTIFPEKTIDVAKQSALELAGPFSALLIKGDNDESGALADIYEKLSLAGIDIDESYGIADIKESYGVIFYMSRVDCDKAAAALKDG